MARHHFWLTYGYSPVFRRGEAEWETYAPLEDILGGFNTIAFEVKHIGEHFFELTIERTGATEDGVIAIADTVAGRVGDTLNLSKGERIQLVMKGEERYANMLQVAFFNESQTQRPIDLISPAVMGD